VRTRAQIVLLRLGQGKTIREIGIIVRLDEETVRTWLKRYAVEGVERLQDRPHSGHPGKVTDEYQEKLVAAVRRRPRSLGLPYSLWTLECLADYLAEQTGIRVSPDTVRRRQDGWCCYIYQPTALGSIPLKCSGVTFGGRLLGYLRHPGLFSEKPVWIGRNGGKIKSRGERNLFFSVTLKRNRNVIEKVPVTFIGR